MNREVPGYVLRELVGAGSTAEVWRGEAVGAPGRLLAIKLVAAVPDRATLAAVQREADLLASLAHPSLLQVLDVASGPGVLGLVTPFAPGGSLAALLVHRAGGIPAVTITDLGARLASALAAAHRADVIHRDVKPANVLFDAEGQPLLGDFGTARLRDDHDDRVIGTAEYLDPSVLEGRRPDPRSDLYALGITLYEALTGAPPYTGATPAQTAAMAARGRFVPIAERMDVPAALATAIETAFARDPADRPDSARAFAGHLDELHRSLSRELDGPPLPARATGRAGVLGAAATGTGKTDTVARRGQPGDDGRSPTVAWGPPAPAASEAPQPAPQPRRWLLAVAAAAVVLVPVAVVAASLVSGASEADLPPADVPAPPAHEPEVVTEPDPVRSPAPACADLAMSDDDRDLLLADVTGLGCSDTVLWDGEQLEVHDGDGDPVRFELGAQPGDRVLFGDWTCDGRDAPALYRPRNGQVFTFDALVGDGEEITVDGVPTGIMDGEPLVRTDPDGCDRVEVERGAN